MLTWNFLEINSADLAAIWKYADLTAQYAPDKLEYVLPEQYEVGTLQVFIRGHNLTKGTDNRTSVEGFWERGDGWNFYLGRPCPSNSRIEVRYIRVTL